MTTLLDLPIEIFSNILLSLSEEDLRTISCVNREVHARCAAHMRSIYVKKIKAEFGITSMIDIYRRLRQKTYNAVVVTIAHNADEDGVIHQGWQWFTICAAKDARDAVVNLWAQIVYHLEEDTGLFRRTDVRVMILLREMEGVQWSRAEYFKHRIDVTSLTDYKGLDPTRFNITSSDVEYRFHL